MRLKKYLWLLPILSFVQIAEASKPLAPSPLRRLCEKALLHLGISRPKTRARISEVTQVVEPIGKYGLAISNGTGPDVVFTRTNRGLFDIRYERYFPKSYLTDESFAGQRTLDLACGDGQLVEELRYQGHDVVGLDIHLTPYQKTKSYYVLADAMTTGFGDQTFDRILAIQGPLTYLFRASEIREKLLNEAHRILRPGGRILISPLPLKSIGDLPTLPPGFRLVAWANEEWMMVPAENNMEEHANFWIELERI